MTAPFAATDRGKDRGSSFLAVKPYASVLAVFLASRLAVVLAVLIADAHLPDAYPDEWRAGEAWRYHLLRWDSQWYWTIASEGYRYDGDSGRAQSVVFYPLYPLISRLVASLFGLSVADAMLIVANLAALLASFLLFKLARDECGDDVALFSVAFLGFFPTSIFLSACYTEPLALVFVLACFLMLRQDRLILAAVFSGLALATRSTGIALLPALAWALWRNVGPDIRRLALYGAPMAALALAGLALFMLYQQRAFGDALAFSHAQAGFHDGTQQIDRMAAALRLEPFARWRFADVSPAGLDQWFFLMFAALTAVAWRRLPATMALYDGAPAPALPHFQRRALRLHVDGTIRASFVSGLHRARRPHARRRGFAPCASRGIRGLARPLRRAIFPMALGWVSRPRQAWRSPILGPAPTHDRRHAAAGSD